MELGNEELIQEIVRRLARLRTEEVASSSPPPTGEERGEPAVSTPEELQEAAQDGAEPTDIGSLPPPDAEAQESSATEVADEEYETAGPSTSTGLRRPRTCAEAIEASATIAESSITASEVAPEGPSTQEDSMSLQSEAATTDREEWETVHQQLLAARDQYRATKAVETASWVTLDEYVKKYGQNDAEVKRFVRIVETERGVREAAAKYRQLERERIAAIEKEKQARREIEEFQLEQRQKQRELNLKAHAAAEERARLLGLPAPVMKRCWVCGLAGVARGRECPRRDQHDANARR